MFKPANSNSIIYKFCTIWIVALLNHNQALAVSRQGITPTYSNQQIFDSVVENLQNTPKDPCVNHPSWSQTVAEFRQHLPKTAPTDHLQTHIDTMLQKCGYPHNSLLNIHDLTFWVIRQIQTPEKTSKSTGIWFKRLGNRWFVNHVFPNSPGQLAGLKRGDELFNFPANNSQPNYAYESQLNTITAETRSLPWLPKKQTHLKLIHISYPKQLASRNTLNFYERNDKKIGYARLAITFDNQSTAAASQQLVQLFQKTDYPIIDLRDSISVGSLSIARTFYQAMQDKKFNPKNKFLTLIVNKSTDWQFEKLADLLKASFPTTIVGISTAGRFNNPQYRFLANSQWLLVMPNQNRASNHLPLRRTPVAPTKFMRDHVVYAGGIDEVLNESIKIAIEKTNQ